MIWLLLLVCSPLIAGLLLMAYDKIAGWFMDAPDTVSPEGE